MRPASRTRASVPRPPAPSTYKYLLPISNVGMTGAQRPRPTWLILGNSCSSKPREAQKYHSISNETDAA